MTIRRRVSAAIAFSMLAVLLLTGCETGVQAGGPMAAPTLPPFYTATPGPGQGSGPAAAAGGNNHEFDWKEGSNLTVAEWWTDPSHAGCGYATHQWPQAQLAASRAYVLGARQVLRDEWDINSWVASHGAATSEARIHGTETGCANAHFDYPPHVHIFYLARDPNGKWQEVNSHNYLAVDGRVDDDFVIANICNDNRSYHVAAGQWLDMLDEKCHVAWQQRYTANGDLELRRDPSAQVYTLRIEGIQGDLASLQVLAGNQVVAVVRITEYDATAMRMTASIDDYGSHRRTTETWQGNPATSDNLTGHSAQRAATNDPAPAAVPAPAEPPPTPAPDTPTPAPTATPLPALPPGVSTTTITPAVSAPGDNVSQDGGTLSSDAKNLWIGDSSDPSASYAGVRFAGVALPPGAHIRSATLEFYAPSADSTKLSVDVYGDAAGSSPPFSPAAPPGSRPATNAHLAYADPPAWAAGNWYSIDVTPIVQEIVARADWREGNALALILKGVSGQAGYRREAKGVASWDKSSAPALVIVYY